MISEDDAADYRQQELEERERNRLIRMGQRGGPDAAEACDAEGCVDGRITNEADGAPRITSECPRCLGTGVQP